MSRRIFIQHFASESASESPPLRASTCRHRAESFAKKEYVFAEEEDRRAIEGATASEESFEKKRGPAANRQLTLSVRFPRVHARSTDRARTSHTHMPNLEEREHWRILKSSSSPAASRFARRACAIKPALADAIGLLGQLAVAINNYYSRTIFGLD